MKNEKARSFHSNEGVAGARERAGAPTEGEGSRSRALRPESRPAAPASGNASGPIAAPDEGLVSGLECRIGKAPIVVPVEHVAQIIDYETSPLPLTRRWITGAGLHDDRLVMTVGLVAEGAGGASAPLPARRRTKGVLLNVPDSKVFWALEVQEVVVLVKATVIERRRAEPRTGDLPPWIGRARTVDGRSIAWIDVAAMLSDLTTAPRILA